jgi:hypothetical protein
MSNPDRFDTYDKWFVTTTGPYSTFFAQYRRNTLLPDGDPEPVDGPHGLTRFGYTCLHVPSGREWVQYVWVSNERDLLRLLAHWNTDTWAYTVPVRAA